ncbi:MAG: deoxyribodipyrimidine photo-lyase [Rhodoferax sp.]|nr:deoxyribodipyrimidine photo-lyase [Rhodoferax sp.]MBP9929089.1 deoxyribodipyrimidine photo-lyase [Rhodoferax sp.]
MNKQFDSGLVWLRRDLRLDDNAALHLALTHCRKVHCAFVFDRAILDPLPRADRRVEFIRESLVELDQALREASGDPHCGLLVRHGQALDEIVALARELGVQSVFAAHDYEPSAIERDRMVFGALAHAGIALHTVKDHVVFERRELLTRTGTPYTVFTPYKKAWLALVNEQQLQSHDITPHTPALAARAQAMRRPVPTLQEIGFAPSNLRALKITPGISGARALFADFFERMDQYHETRDYPSIKGPSYLGVHLRFGTVSIRRLAAAALQASMTGSAGAAVWLSELVWREFYFQILANFPHVAQSAFKPEFDKIRWRHGAAADKLFQAWCDGRTGYPLVDAAMAQINQTGYMHNRLRMVAGSFLVKDLGIDWRRGERYFAEKLNDFDLAANNGGWQWVASSGCDAQPWFRIFNPLRQSENFDPQGRFITRYLPQLAALPASAIHAPWQSGALELAAANIRLGENYPQPLVDHDTARTQTLERYAVVRKIGPDTGTKAGPGRRG